MIQLLKDLKKKCVIGYVGGSDLAKQKEQLGEDAASHLFDFGFSENGATAFKNGQQIGNEVIKFKCLCFIICYMLYVICSMLYALCYMLYVHYIHMMFIHLFICRVSLVSWVKKNTRNL